MKFTLADIWFRYLQVDTSCLTFKVLHNGQVSQLVDPHTSWHQDFTAIQLLLAHILLLLSCLATAKFLVIESLYILIHNKSNKNQLSGSCVDHMDHMLSFMQLY